MSDKCSPISSHDKCNLIDKTDRYGDYRMRPTWTPRLINQKQKYIKCVINARIIHAPDSSKSWGGTLRASNYWRCEFGTEEWHTQTYTHIYTPPRAFEKVRNTHTVKRCLPKWMRNVMSLWRGPYIYKN